MIPLIIANFLEGAERNNPAKCPVALALADLYKLLRPELGATVEVYGGEAKIKFSDGKEVTSRLSEELANEVKHYDETGEWSNTEPVYAADASDVILDQIFSGNAFKQGTYDRRHPQQSGS